MVGIVDQNAADFSEVAQALPVKVRIGIFNRKIRNRFMALSIHQKYRQMREYHRDWYWGLKHTDLRFIKGDQRFAHARTKNPLTPELLPLMTI